MKNKLAVYVAIVGISLGAALSCYGSPPPPPVLPSAVPGNLEGYDVDLIWNIYEESLKNSVNVARENLFQSLARARGTDRLDSDGEIVHRFFKIEGGGEHVEERSTTAVEKVCFQTQPDSGPECRTRLRIAGPLIRNSLPIEENFDAQVAVSNLIQRGISPNELSTSRRTEDELFGLPSAVETLQQSLRFGVLDETTCPQLTTHLNKLLEDTALLVRSQPSDEDA
ncbi:hypothetical protein [Ponticaulis profundi]|uniref:DUF2927 domain-containing protein n=1 Tax=Ponticaulis profundi TaxID=2665222 RepID=A0ABW1SDT9_9PROT